MSLPVGWEWDYDGSRWFYRYKPNGHIQFQFPKEGDEFPDYIDAAAPTPDLAPEEKLESQQQIKRRTTNPGSERKATTKTMMRATGGPMGGFGVTRTGDLSGMGPMGNDDGDDDGDPYFFQPESFMYLGPGSYTDVSPLVDEDEREEMGAMRDEGKGKQRENSNNQGERSSVMLDATGDRSTVSPDVSQSTTPLVLNSEPVQGETVTPEPALSINTKDTSPQPGSNSIASPGVPLLDSRERPHELAALPRPPAPPWDPVGIMAEMATEHTAAAHIETHPDPIEMPDHNVLAPIETFVHQFGPAELPERTSPVEQRARGDLQQSPQEQLQQTSLGERALHHATFGTQSRPQSSSPQRTPAQGTPEAQQYSKFERPTPQPTPQPTPSPQPGYQNFVAPSQRDQSPSDGPFKIARKPTNPGPKPTKYQPYAPGVANPPTPESRVENSRPTSQEHRLSFAREPSLNLGPSTPATLDPSSVPAVLQPPKLPPKHPIVDMPPVQSAPVSQLPPQPPPMVQQSSWTPSPEPDPPTTLAVTATPPVATLNAAQQGPLQHIPSVLRPARGQMQGQPYDHVQAQAEPEQVAKFQAYDPAQQRQTPPHVSLGQGAQQRGISKSVAGPQGSAPAAQQASYSWDQSSLAPSQTSKVPTPQREPAPRRSSVPRSQEPQLYAPPQPGPIPQSLTPAPSQQPALDPRPELSRVGTVPDHMPSFGYAPPGQAPTQFGRPSSTQSTPRYPTPSQTTPAVYLYPQIIQGNLQSNIPDNNNQHGGSPVQGHPHGRQGSQGPASQALAGTQVFTWPVSGIGSSMQQSSVPPTRSAQLQESVPKQQKQPSQPAGQATLSRQAVSRQMSVASDVSSLGPPSGSQSSGALMKTPSPLETPRRPSSNASGFFQGVNNTASMPGYGASQTTSPQNQSPFPVHTPGSRPLSFAGSAPATRLSEVPDQQSPPIVPGKVPLPQPTGHTQSQAPVHRGAESHQSQSPYPPTAPNVGSSRVSQPPVQRTVAAQAHGPANTDESYNRRHSMPADQMANLVNQSNPGSAQVQQDMRPDHIRSRSSSNVLQTQPVPPQVQHGQMAQAVQRSQSVHQPQSPQGSQPTGQMQGHNTQQQNFQTPQYGPPSAGGGKSAVARPQRPVISPQLQQQPPSQGMVTPTRAAGHLLHAIQEHPEADRHVATAPPSQVSQSPQSARRNSQASSHRLSNASSHPPSIDSPGGQMQHPGPPQRTMTGPPALQQMQPGGPMHPPGQQTQFQQQVQYGIGQTAQQTMRPASTPPAVQQPGKDKEKGGWFSKLMKGSGKNTVLQKPAPQQPPQQPPQQQQYPPHMMQQGFPQQQWQNPQFSQQQPPQPTIVQQRPPQQWSVQQNGQQPGWQQGGPIGPPGQPSNIAQRQMYGQGLPSMQAVRTPTGTMQHQGQVPGQFQPQPLAAGPSAQPGMSNPPHQGLGGPPMHQRLVNGPQADNSRLQEPPKGQISETQSDTASVSTMDVSEAQAQPVLKPQLVDVQKTAMHLTEQLYQGQNRQGHAGESSGLPSQATRPLGNPFGLPSQSSAGGMQPLRQNQTLISSGVPRTSAIPQQVQSAAQPLYSSENVALPSQSQQRSEPLPSQAQPVEPHGFPVAGGSLQGSPVDTRDPVNNNYAPAPLFSTSSHGVPGGPSRSATKSSVRDSVVSAVSVDLTPGPKRTMTRDKWAKKPAADYSGGDWGDEDEWDYE